MYGRVGGGASLFIHPKHKFIRRSDLKISVTDCDTFFIEIYDKGVGVGVIYKPDYVDYEQLISHLESVLSIVSKERRNCFIARNFDIDHLKYDHSSQVKNFVTMS